MAERFKTCPAYVNAQHFWRSGSQTTTSDLVRLTLSRLFSQTFYGAFNSCCSPSSLLLMSTKSSADSSSGPVSMATCLEEITPAWRKALLLELDEQHSQTWQPWPSLGRCQLPARWKKRCFMQQRGFCMQSIGAIAICEYQVGYLR